MALKTEPELIKTEWDHLPDFSTLPIKTANHAVDVAYKKHQTKKLAKKLANNLIEQVKNMAQLPLEYIALAEAAIDIKAHKLAENLYTQAEDLCFEAMEFATLSHSMALHTNNYEKVIDLLQRALQTARHTDKFVTNSTYISYDPMNCSSDSCNPELDKLTAKILAKIDEKAKNSNDYSKIVKTLIKNGDQTTAIEFHKKAGLYCSNLTETLSYAKDIKHLFVDIDWSQKILEQAESRCHSVKDFVMLGKSYKELLDDEEKVNELMQLAADVANQPNDLIIIADAWAANVGETNNALKIYRKAFNTLSNFEQYLKLIDSVNQYTGDKHFCKEILSKATAVSSTTPELLHICDASINIFGDKYMARSILLRAEEKVSSADEMADVVKYIKTYYADDSAWVTLAEAKLKQRLTKQSKYEYFQLCETKADTLAKILQLTDDVVAKLNDKTYARKLLLSADKLIEQQGYPVMRTQALVLAVCKHMDDFEWSKRLLEKAVKQVNDFSSLRSLSVISIENMGKPGKDLARSYLLDWKQRLSESETRTSYDYTRLAECVYSALSDTPWANELLIEAEAIGGDHFFWAHMSKITSQMNNFKQSDAYLQKAIDLCTTPSIAVQLINRLFKNRVDNHTVRKIYTEVGVKMKTTIEELVWVENIIPLFRDPVWAKKAYENLAPKMASTDEIKLFNFSRCVRFDFQLKYI